MIVFYLISLPCLIVGQVILMIQIEKKGYGSLKYIAIILGMGILIQIISLLLVILPKLL